MLNRVELSEKYYYLVGMCARLYFKDSGIIYDQSQEPYRIILPKDIKYLVEQGESCKNNWE